jgi:hypothetical protein
MVVIAMGEVLPFLSPADCANYAVVHRRIKHLWNHGDFEPLAHLVERMVKRKLDMNDVQNVIRYGKITEHSKPMDLWRYTVLGKCVEGQPVKCILELDADRQFIILISVMVKGQFI